MPAWVVAGWLEQPGTMQTQLSFADVWAELDTSNFDKTLVLVFDISDFG